MNFTSRLPFSPIMTEAAERFLQDARVAFPELESHFFPLLKIFLEDHIFIPLTSTIDNACKGWSSWQIILFTSLATLLAMHLHHSLELLIEDGGILPATFKRIRCLPFIKGAIEKEKRKLKADLITQRRSKNAEKQGHDERSLVPAMLFKLPEHGLTSDEVVQALKSRARDDIDPVVALGSSTLSGALYMHNDAHRKMLDQAYGLFSVSNPLHTECWPSVRQMEAEVCSMTAGLLGGGEGTEVCGAMTSGGTESILMAMKASRDYIKETKGVRKPEMILASSAHAAYWKACEYFHIKPVIIEVDERTGYRLIASQVKRRINGNTAIIVASAPGFPHGIIDDVEGVSHLAMQSKVCLHVDCCLGGFVLPFIRGMKGGPALPRFDFSCKGVTSISVDTHKFAQSHKVRYFQI